MELCTEDATASAPRGLGILLILFALMVWCVVGSENRARAAEAESGWSTDYEGALQQAQTQNRPVLATVTAVWCGACRQMQQLTLKESSVAQLASEQFVTVAIDGDRRGDLVSRFGVSAFPTTMVLDANGKVLHRWVGFQGASGFHRELQTFAKNLPRVDEFPAVSALFPSNASPFGFGGFCLSSLLDDNKLRRGVDGYTAEYRGIRVCFYSAEHRDRFLVNPERYWPVNNGLCLVSSRENLQSSPGDPRVGVLWKNRLWFFADRDRQQRFIAAPHRFSGGL